MGDLVHAKVTVRHTGQDQDNVYTGHVMAMYWSVGGDSGSPVIHTSGGGKTALLGIHVGSMTWFTVESSGAIITQGNAVGMSQRGQFGVFSTWENVERDLGIPSQR